MYKAKFATESYKRVQSITKTLQRQRKVKKMKKNILNKVLVILIIILLSLISFVGIYVKKGNTRKNILKDYNLGMNLTGARHIKLVVDKTENTIIYDAEGKETKDGYLEDGVTLKEGYTKSVEKENKEEVLTAENYNKAKQIIEKRLDKLGVQEYIVNRDEVSGDIDIELPENTDTDTVASYLTYKGEYKIVDSDTQDVLIDNSMVKEAKVLYTNSNSGGITVYVQIEFDKAGKEKLKEISSTYVETKDENGNDSSKKVSIKLDDETLLETYFDEVNDNGILQLTVGSASKSSEDINTYIKQGAGLAALINSGKMEVVYTMENNVFINSYATQSLPIVICIAVDILAIALLWLYIKNGEIGGIASLSVVGFIALLLIVLRYTNVVISLESLTALVAIVLVDYLFVKYVVDNMKKNSMNAKQALKVAYTKFVGMTIPVLIMAVVFTFVEWIPIASIGMILFWGLIIMAIYNYIILYSYLSKTKIKSIVKE